MLVIGAVTLFLMVADVQGHGYLYLFFYSIPANTAISVFPHEPVLIYYGRFADLTAVAVVATAGTLVAGYLDHRLFVPVLNLESLTAYKQHRFYRKAIDYLMKYPFATLVVTGFTPVPFFPFKFLSFSMGYPLAHYLGALVVGRLPRYWVLAWVGAEFAIPNYILVGSVLVIFGLYLVRGVPALWRRLRAHSIETPGTPSRADSHPAGGEE
ncbi:MAG: hypothetical protein HY701_03860 [Gemmatimonadetes bacterium]|nr:hypothetical protein [Gemmatimonadota bacterium]